MWYTKTFYQHIMFRHSCGNCHFCNTKRPSDITIADFWGWQKQDPNINSDDKGLNLVLVNTPKGKEIFEAIKDRLEFIDASPEAYMQPNLLAPSEMHRLRTKFEKDYFQKGFSYVYTHDYHPYSLKKRIIIKIRSIVNRIFK